MNEKGLKEGISESLLYTELLHIFLEKEEACHKTEDPDQVMAFHKKVHDFVEKLQKKYGEQEVEKRQLVHLIIGSGGMNHKSCPYFDYEGDDSIQKFIREL